MYIIVLARYWFPVPTGASERDAYLGPGKRFPIIPRFRGTYVTYFEKLRRIEVYSRANFDLLRLTYVATLLPELSLDCTVSEVLRR